MKNFGTTLQETLEAFRPKAGRKSNSTILDAWVRICISAILLITGIYFAAANDPARSKLGMTLVGLVTGYWFK
jgi:hypothetical protein